MSNKLDQKRKHWAQHVSAWQTSNLSQQAYCQKHDLTPHQFTYWKSKTSTTCGRPEKVAISSQVQAATFVPVEMLLQAEAPEVTIQLPNGARIMGVNVQTVPIAVLLMEAVS